MLVDFGFTVEFDPRDLTIGRDILRKLEEFPPDTWSYIEDEVKKVARNTANRITRYSVKKSTVKWREWARKKGREVGTYKGSSAVPLSSPRVGRRTGTFIGDLRESEEPGVIITTGPGEYKIRNGSFRYSINADAFTEVGGWGGYPNIFFNYLQQRGIISEEGFLFISEAEENLLLDYLEEKVSSHWSEGISGNH